MHLMDRVVPLDEPTGLAICLGSGLLAIGGVAWSGRNLDAEEIPRLGLLTAWLFVASSIRVPLPVGVTVHLSLCGLAGFFLGRRVLVAIVGAIFLQRLLMQHGGWTTLGVNILTSGIGGLAGWGLASLDRLPLRLRAFTAGFGGLVLGATLTAAVLLASGYPDAILIFMGTYLALGCVEGALTYFVLEAVERFQPRCLRQPSRVNEIRGN